MRELVRRGFGEYLSVKVGGKRSTICENSGVFAGGGRELGKSLRLHRYGGHRFHEFFARELSREVQGPGNSIHEFADRCQAYHKKLARPALTGERATF